MRMSMIARSGLSRLDRSHERAGVTDHRDDLVPLLGEDPREALAEQDGVFGDDDAHLQITAVIVVPSPVRSRSQGASDREDAVAESG